MSDRDPFGTARVGGGTPYVELYSIALLYVVV